MAEAAPGPVDAPAAPGPVDASAAPAHGGGVAEVLDSPVALQRLTAAALWELEMLHGADRDGWRELGRRLRSADDL